MEDDDDEQQPYKKVMQMSQPIPVPKPLYLKPKAYVSGVPDVPEPASELYMSPLKTYYVQKAFGVLCTHVVPMLDDHFSGDEILPNLWLATHASVCNLQSLQDRNISHIICAILGVSPRFPQHIRYTCLPLRDIETEDIFQYFHTVADLIHADLSEGRAVLAHCKKGRSRSASLVCAYLIKYHGMSHTEAIRFAQSKRPCVNPIRSFRLQLQSFENHVRMETKQ